MKKEAFQEIARHFAESIKVNLVFEDGATPATNGDTIILPTEMSEDYLDETLGALLHETNHIRYTDFKAFSSWDELSRVVGNCLEDIRIDNKSLSIYPNSRCFYMSLVEDVIARCKDKLDKEALPIKCLKGLVLNSVGVDLKRVYGADENFKTIDEKVTNLQGTINDCIKCDKTDELPPYIVKVIKEIFGDLPPPKPPEQKQQSQGDPDNKQCNGGQSQQSQSGDSDSDSSSSSPSQSSSNGKGGTGNGNSSGQGTGVPSMNDAGEIFEDYTELLEKDTELQEKLEEVQQERTQASQKRMTTQRSAKTYNTKARNLERKQYRNGPLTTEEKEKLDHYKAKSAEKWQENSEAGKEVNDSYVEQRQLEQERNQFDTALDKLKAQMNKIVTTEFARTGNCDLLGFSALDDDKLKDKDYQKIDYNPTLDELIKEVLILKQEEYEIEETGKLNPRYFHEIYTDTENLFQEKEEHEIKTMVSVVMDVSGSMGGDRPKLILHAVNTLASSFSKAIAQGAPGDMRIFAFGTDVIDAIQTVDKFKPITIPDYMKWMEAGGGSTNLSLAVNKVVTEVENEPDNRNIIIIMTDAEVDSRELNTMVNNISTGDAKVMYIAIDSSLRCKEAQELFGDSNITTLENANQIIQDVMFAGLQTLN